MTNPSQQIMETYLTKIASSGHLELIDDLFHEDMTDEAAIAFGGPHGREGLVAHVKGFRKHIGNLEVTINEIVADTDKVMAQWSFSGTHDGPWLGRKATHGPVHGTVFSYFTLRAGRVSRYRLWLHATFENPRVESVVFDSANPVLPR